MKLVICIVNGDDASAITQALSRRGFSSTRLSTAGGLLSAGNVTLLIGVDEERVQTVIDIVRTHSHSRKQMVESENELSHSYTSGMPVEVTVGGATIFVIDVERFERI